MTIHDALHTALSGMILSHSGWRGVFAAEDQGISGEESTSARISAAHRLIAAAAALVFAEYLAQKAEGVKPLVLLGRDTRPTGKAIIAAMIPVLQASGCTVSYAGITAAPEIMAWARKRGNDQTVCGFIYISASHNPIGHNGFKFGLADGGVLPAAETAVLTASFRTLLEDSGAPARLERLIAGAALEKIDNPNLKAQLDPPNTVTGQQREGAPAGGRAAESIWNSPPEQTNEKNLAAKRAALDAYRAFSSEVAWDNHPDIADAFQRGIARRPLGICADFNGSARCVSIDADFWRAQGIQFQAINAEPGAIVHRIVPEGESLEPCRAFLARHRRDNPAFILGYVPDCDGDRGNLVVGDAALETRALEAQEVFALACVAELAQLAWTGSLSAKTAVVVNDPTSLRIDRIAAAFGAAVFRAEVGEANVVALARTLRESGWTVRILGEGSAGGNITHPSAVRDPLHTVLALAKLLSLRGENGKPGLFELWCAACGRQDHYHAAFGLADIIASLPPFVTTGAYSPEAVLKVTSADQRALKNRYQAIFQREWEQRAGELKARYGICRWEAAAYNGIEERRGIVHFGDAGSGGLKICFFNDAASAIAALWMRGSATEPVFRIMADAEGESPHLERELIEWQRHMTIEADRS